MSTLNGKDAGTALGATEGDSQQIVLPSQEEELGVCWVYWQKEMRSEKWVMDLNSEA